MFEKEHAGFVIGQMTEHDLLEVVEIEEACGLSLWGWDAYRTELDRPESIMLAARRGAPDARGRTLGGFLASRISADELHVNNIGVRFEERRRGLGGVLLALALDAAAEQGATLAVLEVRAGNLAAQALYRRSGFAVVGTRRNYYRQPPEDALVMTRPLAPPT
jgi:ribosomal-protein-alanine N-acetyltransferase